MIHSSKVLVIIGSVRARRIGPQIATWIADTARDSLSCDVEIVDLKEWPLPMDDEPGIPAAHGHVFTHTAAWSVKIASAGAFIFVTPQYNWGYPAALKNALDHLYKEWSGKPAMIVSYGGHGGGKAAAQLRRVLEALRMAPVSPMPALTLARDRIEANDGVVDAARQFTQHEVELREALAALKRGLSAKTSPTK